ncbi:MAPEG family protein [Paracoccus aerodenitrificans]|uniref:MAPEG family protein n=1 Tax=Paracoccus aerodenitrificans TaxID=3017781 RepID=UPI0022F020D3|nr:MAPEG family protein [Paracoccus aerodenitrificans]WBU65065.1 MAPEG family protein [Paracoccus aerodenitrificans]
MAAELTVLALAALLQAFQIGLAGMVMNSDVGATWNTGPRDSQPEFSALTGRLRRAVNNHFEGLVFFTIAVVVVTASGQESAVTAASAWIYLLARVLYIPAYALGWSPWRSVIWACGFMASLVMLFATLF